MKKSSSTLILSILLLVSCNKAVVKGSFTDAAPASGVITVKIPEGKELKTIDTVKLGRGGSFRYVADVKKGQPEFFYLYNGERKLASLVLDASDKVQLCCDTLGNWTVTGSEDCALLRENELDLASQMASGELTYRQYTDYYRKMVRFVLSNSHSITVVPVLYSKLWDTPVFSRASDAVIMSSAADSLETVYPDSRYVRQLRADSKRRMDQLKVMNMVQAADSKAFPELDLPDLNGQKQRLSEYAAEGKTLLVFWDCTDASSADLNLGLLLPYYKKTGIRIYQVNIGMNKNNWARIVKSQELPWMNVCDIYGSSISAYGLDVLPCAFIMDDASMKRVPLNALN